MAPSRIIYILLFISKALELLNIYYLFIVIFAFQLKMASSLYYIYLSLSYVLR